MTTENNENKRKTINYDRFKNVATKNPQGNECWRLLRTIDSHKIILNGQEIVTYGIENNNGSSTIAFNSTNLGFYIAFPIQEDIKKGTNRGALKLLDRMYEGRKSENITTQSQQSSS